MANMNIRTPRFYCDYISYLLNRGVAQNTNFDVTATGGSGATATRGLQSGTEAELFDMRPLNTCSFDTGGAIQSQVLVTLNMQSANPKQSFVAILNHNLATAAGKIRVFAGDDASDVTAIDGGNADTSDVNWGSVSVTESVNADSIATNAASIAVQPATDGSTIFTFPEQDLRYWGIQFEGTNSQTDVISTDGTWGADLTIGCIIIGEYFDMPVSPDLNVKRTIDFDGVTQQKSIGGQIYSNMSRHGRTGSSTSKSPFTTSSSDRHLYGGRLIYNMKFSYLNSTDLMPDEYLSKDFDDDAVVEDIWNITNGSHLPFIFSCDNTSLGNNAESEHIFARFAQDSLSMEQVAPDVFNVELKIQEEF